MKQIKNIKKFNSQKTTHITLNFSPVLIVKFIYNFSRLTQNQKLYLLKTMENIRKYNL